MGEVVLAPTVGSILFRAAVRAGRRWRCAGRDSAGRMEVVFGELALFAAWLESKGVADPSASLRELCMEASVDAGEMCLGLCVPMFEWHGAVASLQLRLLPPTNGVLLNLAANVAMAADLRAVQVMLSAMDEKEKLVAALANAFGVGTDDAEERRRARFFIFMRYMLMLLGKPRSREEELRDRLWLELLRNREGVALDVIRGLGLRGDALARAVDELCEPTGGGRKYRLKRGAHFCPASPVLPWDIARAVVNEAVGLLPGREPCPALRRLFRCRFSLQRRSWPA
jgi:hypothetical protein